MERAAAGDRLPAPTLWTRLVTPFAAWMGKYLIGRPRHGAITIHFPNGKSRTFGNPATGQHAEMRILNYGVVTKTLRRGTVGFAQAYMDGDVEIDDLTVLFRYFLQNRDVLDTTADGKQGAFRRATQDLAYHMSRQNSKEGARRNISEHYDLGNDFYGQWLDPSMTYSSALFTSEDLTLEEAQHQKYRRIADAAGVSAGSSVLEIGCGWGGFAETAARDYGASVYGITLSAEQLKFATDRMARQGLANLVALRLEDYRDTEGQFDHIASIEMVEAVGEAHWPTYFQAVHDRLKPGGTAAIQAITIDERDFDNYRAGPDFIQRYIFPGGMLPTKDIMREQGARVGLILEEVEYFRLSYARTLRLWADRFKERWSEIKKLGYDEVFRRKWLYYLSYCEAGFLEGSIDVGIYQYRRPA